MPFPKAELQAHKSSKQPVEVSINLARPMRATSMRNVRIKKTEGFGHGEVI
jgi:hypothetical protein